MTCRDQFSSSESEVRLNIVELLLIIIYKICKEVLLHYKQQIIVNMREVGFEPTNP
jgi:hypothetical protein